MAALAALSGCATIGRHDDRGDRCPAIIERAIAARGGAIANLRRTAEINVHFGFPGVWHLEYMFRAPDLYRWTVLTSEAPNYYLWDGSTMRAAVGSAIVGSDDSGLAPLRSHARWHAVTYLDSLCNGGLPARFFRLPTIDSGDETILVHPLDGGGNYQLTFDRQARLRRATGPIEVPPFGKSELTQSFYDFHRAGGFLIAHTTRYEINGTILSEETTTSFVANDPTITIDQFRHPPAPR